MEIIIGLVVAVLIVFVLYNLYAKIITRRNRALEALAGIDVQLTQRFELIPNILTMASKFMEHEKELFTSVTELRTQASENYDKADPAAIKDHLSASSRLGTQMGKLMINMEDYPDLKSNETMIQAQQTYNEVEAQIAAARRFYNSSVTELNNTIEIFPGNLLAGIANSKSMPFLEADEAVLEPINATDYFK